MYQKAQITWSQSYETFTSVIYEQSANFYELTKMNPMKLFLENYLKNCLYIKSVCL